jgi:hypothetical protein
VDDRNEEVWFHRFPKGDGLLKSQTVTHDHHFNYNFYVPHIPPGTYTLTIEVIDQTCPDQPRSARRSVPIRVRR